MGNPLRKKVLSGVALFALAAAGVALAVGNDLAFNRHSAVISHHLAPNGDKDSAEAKAAYNMGNQLAREIEREGIVLLKNDGVLPFKKAINKVNVFGHGSVDWYYMSSGSERVGMEGQTSYNLNEALTKYGIAVNQELPEYYLKWHKAEGDANTIQSGGDSFYQIREPNLETDATYQDVYKKAKAYSDTALFVVSRHAGENSDCPHYQNKLAANGNSITKDQDRTYLQISTEEEYAIKQLAEDFENVIIVINSTNCMQLNFLDEIEGIDGCISVGATGVQGALSIPEVLWGDASPSGHLTDTMPYDHRDNITYYRGNHLFTRQYTGAPSNCTQMGYGGQGFYNTSVYVEYSEGIYVGYRWFETADVEGYWDARTRETTSGTKTGYDAVVQYPFGYGLSYTDFKWTLLDTSIPKGSNITNEDKIVITVQVENVGNMTGKDVIGVYLNAPYTPGGIEKSSVKLVAYAKSPELKKGMKAKVEIEVDAKEFKSYDCYDDNGNGFKGYEMETGKYELRLQTDAHHLKDMGGSEVIEYNVAKDIRIENDEKTGNEVKNRFTGEDAYEEMPIDGSSVGQDIHFLKRNEIKDVEMLTAPEANKPWDDRLKNRAGGIVSNNTCFNSAMASAWDNASEDWMGRELNLPDSVTWDSTATSHKLMESGQLTAVGQKLGDPANWNDPLWDEVLDQVPFDHAKHILTMDTQYKAPGIAAIGLRTNDDGAFQHAEGASQVGNGYMAPGTSCVGYPGSTVLAQTWNQTLAYMFGKSEGNDMGPAGKDALYSPACNIHRSPYGGRNSGYQSEDPYLSGRVVGNLIRGLGVYGRTSFMKHFVVNEQDFNRMALYTWLNEQALREIYLRPFEEGVKFGDSTGIMTSFNRLGGIWAGGNEALMTNILREEWGFKGQIITDMTENEDNMDAGANLRSGGNINLGGDGSPIGLNVTKNSPIRLQYRMRMAIKEIAYGYTHALWKNWTYNEAADPKDAVVVVETKLAWQWWKPTLVAVDILAYAGIAIGAMFIVKNAFLVKKEVA